MNEMKCEFAHNLPNERKSKNLELCVTRSEDNADTLIA